MSQSAFLTGFSLQVPQFRGAAMQEVAMKQSCDAEYRQIPGLFRLWDLQFVFNRSDDYQVHYVEQTTDGAALFAVYRREQAGFSHE
ncbi:hypothetical protein [Roseovarius sp. ZX-A-9]|uniref:hypothetical protein n=1 Tax=Roseovarius sp. ZX-A-9 TaxID=3014783 RepID=UPI00232E4340|nr:hypothetical protein [Roseovarius sp. ZX-A-9]